MGWWSFSSTNSRKPSSGAEDSTQKTEIRGSEKTEGPSQHPRPSSPTLQSETPSSATLKSLEDARKAIEPSISSSDFSKELDAFKQKWKETFWPDGVTSMPVFILSGIFLTSSAIPTSMIPGTTPRLARLAFGGAFGTAGMAIRSGDQWNGASIATWWSLSHIILASLAKSYRKELAKRTGKPPPSSSPLAWALTAATLATGAAYGTAI